MKSLKEMLYESILDVEDNIVKATETIKKFARISEDVAKFEDDMFQFITKELQYLPNKKKGLPFKYKTIPHLGQLQPELGIQDYAQDDDAVIKKEETAGKYYALWKLTLSQKMMGIEDMDEFAQACADCFNLIMNSIKKYVEEYIKKHKLKYLLVLIPFYDYNDNKNFGFEVKLIEPVAMDRHHNTPHELHVLYVSYDSGNAIKGTPFDNRIYIKLRTKKKP